MTTPLRSTLMVARGLDDANMPGPAESSEAPEPRPKLTVSIHDRLTWGLEEIGALTGLSRRTLERLRTSGRLPRPDLHAGRRVLWKPDTIRSWINAQK